MIGTGFSTALFGTYFLFWQGRFREVSNYTKIRPDVEKYPSPFLGNCRNDGGPLLYDGRPVHTGLGMLDAIRDYCLKKGDIYLAAHSGWVIALAMMSVNRIEDACDI
jgi:hypothetical protein